jgi:hypothetical protein
MDRGGRMGEVEGWKFKDGRGLENMRKVFRNYEEWI